MEYVKLIDYLDNPELIQHEKGQEVHAIHHFPNNPDDSKITVVFGNGDSDTYLEDGRYVNNDSNSEFILKPKPKTTVIGWKRAVIFKNGRIWNSPIACPTKEEFMQSETELGYKYGPWEKVEIEVTED